MRVLDEAAHGGGANRYLTTRAILHICHECGGGTFSLCYNLREHKPFYFFNILDAICFIRRRVACAISNSHLFRTPQQQQQQHYDYIS